MIVLQAGAELSISSIGVIITPILGIKLRNSSQSFHLLTPPLRFLRTRIRTRTPWYHCSFLHLSIDRITGQHARSSCVLFDAYHPKFERTEPASVHTPRVCVCARARACVRACGC